MNSPMPLEPVLALDDIQGIAVPGFFKPHQTLLCVRYRREAADIARVKAFIRHFARRITNGRDTLADRRAHRESVGSEISATDCPPLLAIAFTYPGLLGLTPQALSLRGEAFRRGLAARSALLGDPVDPRDLGHPTQWLIGKPGEEPDFMIVVAGDSRECVDHRVQGLMTKLGAFATVATENGDRLLDEANGNDPELRVDGREHFGFADGISQPGIRGRASSAAHDYIAERTIRPMNSRAWALYGLPGQDLVWPGEFVLGYPKSGPDPLWPGPIDDQQPGWARNGSFLVYRRLRQDVRRFWHAMNAMAGELKKKPGFRELTPKSLAAQLVGRRPSGAPLSRLPGLAEIDCPRLGRDRYANNNFRFESDAPPRKLDGVHGYRRALTDPLGLACPLASHIRKVNPRDSAADVGGTSAAYTRRILRVGVPYGPLSKDPLNEPESGQADRGVLFLSIQASIEDQFEFLQARWMNDDRRPSAGSGHDLIAGRNAGGPLEARRPALVGDDEASINERNERRRCTLFGAGGQEGIVEMINPAVTPTGGGYFFVPSLSAIRDILAT